MDSPVGINVIGRLVVGLMGRRGRGFGGAGGEVIDLYLDRKRVKREIKCVDCDGQREISNQMEEMILRERELIRVRSERGRRAEEADILDVK